MIRDQETRPSPLTRGWGNRVIAGVCSGLSNHLRVETWVVRVAAVILLFAEPVIALLAYLIAWATIPSETDSGLAPARRTSAAGGRVIGIILVMAGVVIALKELAPWLDFTFLGAAAMVALGAIILSRGRT